jgi:hypothetical protein
MTHKRTNPPELYHIVLQYLKDNGYSGLISTGQECGCEIDDLMPCEQPSQDCTPGYKCTCEYCAREGSTFSICPTKNIEEHNDDQDY